MNTQNLFAWAAELRADVARGITLPEWKTGGLVDQALHEICGYRYRVYNQAIIRTKGAIEQHPDFFIMRNAMVPRRRHTVEESEQAMVAVEIKPYQQLNNVIDMKIRALEQVHKQMFCMVGGRLRIGTQVGNVAVVGEEVAYGRIRCPVEELEVDQYEDDYFGILQAHAVEAAPWQLLYDIPCLNSISRMFDAIAATL